MVKNFILNDKQIRFLVEQFISESTEVTYETPDTPKPWIPGNKILRYYFNSIKINPLDGLDDTTKTINFKHGNTIYSFDRADVNFGRDKFTNKQNAYVTDEVFINKYGSPSEKKGLSKYETITPKGVDIKSISRENVKSLIKKILPSVFKEYWREKDDYYTAGLRDIYTIGEKLGITGETWSIMNFFDTKNEIHDIILNKYKDENKEIPLENWIPLEDWMINKFENDKPFLEMLVDEQWNSIKSGINTETKVKDFLCKKYPNAKIQTFLPGSRMDRFEGIDMIVNGKTLQIKPLKGIEEKKNHYLVRTYGMKNTYKEKSILNYIAYVGDKDKIILFPNTNYYVVNSNSVEHYSNPTDLESLM
jgi:hypothetical protein